MAIFSDRHILLGVTGSIAGYKAADLASKLAQAGAKVDVILTGAGQKFITPLTFQSVTGRRAYTDQDLWGNEAHVLHVNFGKTADLLLIAPCTADTMAKLAHGIADNLLTVTALAAQCPLVIAPAMDGGMFSNAVTQKNLEILKKRGTVIVGPAEGHLASGLTGTGRMVEPAEIFGQLRVVLGKNGNLAGKKIIITAGGTQESIDPVRVITNHSSGKQGYAVAQAALDNGADVCLITAPTALTPPVGARVIKVNSARDMLDSVLAEPADVLIMAAAVADFTPKTVARDKMKKRDGIPQIELVATADILGAVSSQQPGLFQVVVGFAAESQSLFENAAEKLKSKKLDLIVANDISAPDAGFAVDTNRVIFLFANGTSELLPLMSKMDVAERIVEHISRLLR
jgi:phosphopantothenoylcysteine decarboxylase/phosphopantothenate--cysteine ligase